MQVGPVTTVVYLKTAYRALVDALESRLRRAGVVVVQGREISAT